MSVFTSSIILIMAVLIQLLLWLSPGVFAVFYHHSLGTTSAKKADDRSLSFIVGVEISTILIFFIIYSIVIYFTLENNFISPTSFYIMTGLLIFSACFSFFTYSNYPRKLANALIHHAEHAKNRTDTIILGFITTALELFSTLPLYIICTIAIFNISLSFGPVFIIIYTVAATIPLFIIRTYFHTGHNLAEIIRFHVNHGFLFKILLSLFFIIIAITVLTAGLTQGGLI